MSMGSSNSINIGTKKNQSKWVIIYDFTNNVLFETYYVNHV